MSAIHKKVTITVNTFEVGVKGAVKSSDGMTTHTIDAFVRVDRNGNPIAVCNGPDYGKFASSFGMDNLQYSVNIQKNHFVICVRKDASNSNGVYLALGNKELSSEGLSDSKTLKFFDTGKSAFWDYKVYAERRAGAMFDEFPCSCDTHTEDILDAN